LLWWNYGKFCANILPCAVYTRIQAAIDTHAMGGTPMKNAVIAILIALIPVVAVADCDSSGRDIVNGKWVRCQSGAERTYVPPRGQSENSGANKSYDTGKDTSERTGRGNIGRFPSEGGCQRGDNTDCLFKNR
jgi:hypothetical protein